MYLHSFDIQNMRSIARFEADFEDPGYAGWHVFLGENGSGKSTLIRAIALALVGVEQGQAARPDWRTWIGAAGPRGRVRIDCDYDPSLDFIAGGGRAPKRTFIPSEIVIVRDPDTPGAAASPAAVPLKPEASRYFHGAGRGWFCASYGPFRRFAGGNPESAKLFYSHPKLASHLTAFGEEFALTECLDWLKQLQFRALEEASGPSAALLESLKLFVNESDLLPGGARIERVTSSGVEMVDTFGNRISVEHLSDGFRSVLSMTFELIRQMTRAYGDELVGARLAQGVTSIDLPGIVLIDEVDAHLHPSWQQRIGRWFRACFPRVQFIVTTHSPLVCQAAAGGGSIWRLPAADGRGPAGRVGEPELSRLLYGNLLDAYSTEFFGLTSTKSPEGRQRTQRLAQLNVLESEKKLSAAEAAEREHLRRSLPTAGPKLPPRG